MKFNKGQILKNVSSSWFSLGVNVVTGFILSPFIVHHLGDEAFGLWILIFSVTGYYGLFDLGIRSSIVRYVAKYSANGEYGDVQLQRHWRRDHGHHCHRGLLRKLDIQDPAGICNNGALAAGNGRSV